MKSKIEVAPKEYCIRDVTYNEAILYCFQLVIDGKTGWRIPTADEWFITQGMIGWYIGKSDIPHSKFDIFPVRDI